MFKTSQISKAIWWGARSYSPLIVPPLTYSFSGAIVHVQHHYLPLVLDV